MTAFREDGSNSCCAEAAKREFRGCSSRECVPPGDIVGLLVGFGYSNS